VDDRQAPESKSGNRRRSARVTVAGIALLRGDDGACSVWRVTNLSTGGASLLGNVALLPGRLSLSLHVAGFPALPLSAKVLRRQLARGGRCAVEFVALSDSQRQALEALTQGEASPISSAAAPRALVVGPEGVRTAALSGELASLGFAPRQEEDPAQAAAWMQKEKNTQVLLVDESAIEADGWSLLQFAHDTAPQVRRFVLANDVRAFRLYLAIKAGLVDGMLEFPLPAGALAQRLIGAPVEQPRPARRRAARTR
jgi:hypothetical protein